MENKKNITYSVIIPTFNSSGAITTLCDELVDVFKEVESNYEIIIVNDGGNFSTWEKLEELFNHLDCKISIIRLSKNYGQHNATLCGIKNSMGDVIITIDDDLQVKPKEILKLIDAYKLNNPDIVYGIYTSKKHNTIRNAGSAWMKGTSKMFLRSTGKGSSFRLFKKEIAEKIVEHSQNFVFIDELFHWYTDNIYFVEVEHHKTKKSRYSLFSLIKLTFDVSINYTVLPLKIITYLGLTSSVISFALGVYFIVRKIYKDVPLGYTSVIVAVLFSASVIMVSLGVLGQYIFKLYQIQNKKPPFFIKQKLSK